MKLKVNDLVILRDVTNNDCDWFNDDYADLQVHGEYPENKTKVEAQILEIRGKHILVRLNGRPDEDDYSDRKYYKPGTLVLWYPKREILRIKTLTYEETL